jgi:hypothetical protein
MKRFFSIGFIVLVLLTGVGAFAPSASAYDQVCTEPAILNNNTGQCETFDSSGNSTSSVDPTVTTDDSTALPSDSASAGTPATPNDVTKAENGFGFVMMSIMELFAWLVGVAALLLDNAVYYTVVKMGSYVSSLSAVGVTWRIMRDIGNIVLIFGFLAIGIATILQVSLYGWGQKALPKLLIAAVFLNFSLFVSEAVIDTGNFFATQFYTQINGGQMAGAKNFDSGTLVRLENEGISSKLMAQLGLQSIYGEARNKDIFNVGNTWVIGFMGILLFIVTAFVMFALAFILIARFVILLFLIIVAPIGFAGLAVPKLENTAKKWWSMLFEQTITAPVLLLLLYIALAVITDAQFLTGLCIPNPASDNPTCASDKVFGWVNGNFAGFASFILSFIIAMGLMAAVVIMSKRMSAFGGSWATKMGGKLSFGLTAFGLRSTVGLGSFYAGQRIRRSSWGGTKTGRVISGAFERGGKASFDTRGIKMFGGLKAANIDAGDAQKGGYVARRDKSIKEHEAYVKSIGKAFDDAGPTKDQTKAIADADKAQKEAEKNRKDLQDKNKDHKAELDRLAAVVTANRNSGIRDPKAISDLAAANTAFEASKTALKAAQTSEEAADKALKEAKAAPTVAKKEQQKNYAENIQGKFFGSSFPGWVLFGPGAAAASRKIIKDVTKDPSKDMLDKLTKAAELADKESSGGGEKEEEKSDDKK